MHPIPPALSVVAQYSSYCGHAHRLEGERVVQEMAGGSGGSGFRLQELERSHDKYESVKTQFTSKWLKTTRAPTVENIFLIKVSRSVHVSALSPRGLLRPALAPNAPHFLDRFQDMEGVP